MLHPTKSIVRITLDIPYEQARRLEEAGRRLSDYDDIIESRAGDALLKSARAAIETAVHCEKLSRDARDNIAGTIA